MTARQKRKKNRRKSRKLNWSSKWTSIFVLVSIVVLALVLLIFKVLSYELDNQISIAIIHEDGSGEIVVFNQEEKQQVNLLIPQKTILNVARQRGEWRMESLYKLIESEDLSNQVYADTIMKSFHLPVDAWSFEKPVPLSPGKSNLSYLDRLYLWLGRPGRSIETIDLAETNYLRFTKLVDGDEGYVIADQTPPSIRQIFVQPEISNGNLRVEIVNQTGLGRYAFGDFAAILENLGIHIVSIKGEAESDVDCIFRTTSSNDYLEKLTKMLGCNIKNETSGNFTFTVVLGKEFVRRF